MISQDEPDMKKREGFPMKNTVEDNLDSDTPPKKLDLVEKASPYS